MAHNYGVRYLTVDQFLRYCSDLNVKTDSLELEHYEKAGIMLPVARVVYPEDYASGRTLWSMGAVSEPPAPEQWPELQRLFDKPRTFPEQYADLQDEELINSFDRELGKNSYLIRPTPGSYKPWDSYAVLVPYRDGQQLSGSTADHYYSYWQVHHLYYLQQYQDLYKNKILLDQISEDIKLRLGRPWAPGQGLLREFNGRLHMFDALSFWITVSDRERNRTFARIPVKHQVKHLDASQLQLYRERLAADAKSAQARYGITTDDLYEFVHQLLELYRAYRGDERYKLSDELRNDILCTAQFIHSLTGAEWDVIADELGNRHGVWAKLQFRHLDILTQERDEAHQLLTFYTGKYSAVLGELKISSPKRTFSTAAVDELLDYCEQEGLSILATALSGMIATEDEYAEKFRRASRYTNLKNVLTSLEFLLKNFAGKGSIAIDPPTLNPTIRNVMKNEAWHSIFVTKVNMGLTRANNSAEFLDNLNQLVRDQDLVQSEDAYWARVFLIASLTRNRTVHAYPDDDWFYGEMFGEMLSAAIYAVLYSWEVAKKEGWV